MVSRNSPKVGLASIVLSSFPILSSCTEFGRGISQQFALSAAQTYMQESIKKDVNPQQTVVNVQSDFTVAELLNGSNRSASQEMKEPVQDIKIWECVDLNGDEQVQNGEYLPESRESIPKVPWLAHISLGDYPGDYYLKDEKGKTIDEFLGIKAGKGLRFGRVPPGEYTIYAKNLSNGQLHTRKIQFTGDYDVREVRVWQYTDRNSNGVKDEGEMDPNEIYAPLAEIHWMGLFFIPHPADYSLLDSSNRKVSEVNGVEKGRGASIGVQEAGLYTIVARDRETGKEFKRKVRFTGILTSGGQSK